MIAFFLSYSYVEFRLHLSFFLSSPLNLNNNLVVDDGRV